MKRHVKEQSVLSCFPPSSPGSCLAHKESSKSLFLPIFLPLVLLLRLPKSQPLFRPSLFSRPSLPPILIPFASQLLSSAPFSLLSPHANARTKRNCSRGSSSPHLTRVLPDPLLYPILPFPFPPWFPKPLRLFGQIWFTNEIRSDVPIASCPLPLFLTALVLLSPRFSSRWYLPPGSSPRLG